MVRVINQETFDDVVKENMEEFGMTTEEAVEEAVQQFEAQGVNLSNIIKTKMIDGKSPVEESVARLQELVKLKSASPLNMHAHLATLRSECEKDLARKVLAGKHGAYVVILDVLDKFSNDEETVLKCVEAIVALMDGFPDLLDSRGVMTITSLLNTSKNAELVKLVLKWARVCCVNHEFNRQTLMDSGIVKPMKSLIEEEDRTEEVLAPLCGLLRALTLDDDVRAEVSKAHLHASSLAIELLCPLTNLLAKHKGEKCLVLELLMTMNSLIVRNEFCMKVEEAGGITFAVDVLTEYPDCERIVRNGLMLIKGLSGSDEVKKKIEQAGALNLVLMALERHQKSVPVCNAGLSCITILSLRSQENSKFFVDQGVAELMLQIMKMHSKNLKIQRNCCWAIRNIASRSAELRLPFVKLGAEELINAARRQHPEIDYDAKSALRDLGLEAHLIEQWKGKGKEIAK